MPRNVPGTSWVWPPHVARHPRKHHVSPSEATSSQSVRQRRCRARPDYQIEPDAHSSLRMSHQKGGCSFAAMKSGNSDSRRSWRSYVKGMPYVVALHPHRAKTVSPVYEPAFGHNTTRIVVISLLSTALSLTSKLDKVNIRPTFVLYI